MTKRNIKVSVIIPVFNAEPYIGECIDSCLEQYLTKDELEVIAVDDNSSDSSERILREI
jgi:glycosyltransferase involved in cell wall biosynthesis